MIFTTAHGQKTYLTLVSSFTTPSPDEVGSGGEGSGSGCDSPSCNTDQDIYFSTPPNAEKPRVDPVHTSDAAGSASLGSMALALCGLALALLAPHLR